MISLRSRRRGNARRTPGQRRALLALAAVLGQFGVIAGVMLSTPADAEEPRTAVILQSSVTGGIGSLEATNAIGNGFTVDLKTDAQWVAMTAADFAAYDLVIVGDPTCNVTSSAVSLNADALADAVMARAGGRSRIGNRMLIGTDPVFHRTAGGAKLIETGIDYVSSRTAATNLYLDLSCSDPNYDGVGGPDVVTKLLPKLTVDPTPDWTETFPVPCSGEVSLISNAAQFSTLTSANLKNWFCSSHMTFPTYPTDWAPLAVSTDAPTDVTCGNDVDTGLSACGESYILIAGTGITATAPNLSLSPLTSSGPVFSNHTVTATVSDPDTMLPLAGVLVNFLVTGANNGMGSCTTLADGKCTFSYIGASPGDDTIFASITLDGATQSATAERTWVALPSAKFSINDVSVVEGAAGTVPAKFTVSLAAPATAAASVNFLTQNGTATAPADYMGTGGTLFFAVGEQTKDVTVQVKGDLINEPDETFNVLLAGPSGGSIVDGVGVGTIIDDDRDGQFYCRAVGTRMHITESNVSNPAGTPCVDATKTSLTVPLGLLGSVKAIKTATDQTPNVLNLALPAPGDNAKAHAETAAVSLLAAAGVNVSLSAVSADASATCTAVDGTPVLAGSSKVVGLSIGGAPQTQIITKYTKIAIPLKLLTIELNKTTIVGGQLKQQAVVITSPLLGQGVVIGEAVAGYTGAPCSS